MKCPACKSPLVVVERESIEVDWCTHCHGVWFDVGELELLAGKAGKRLEPGTLGRVAGKVDEARRRCPRCRRKMEKVTLADDDTLLLDRCPEHGLWFDAGELTELMSHLEAESDAATVVGFLNETFTYSPAGVTNTQSTEPHT